MNKIDLRVQSKNEPGPLFPELVGKVVHDLRLERFAILENGMESGEPSVALIAAMPDDSYIFLQCSAEQFLTVAAGVKGAMSRFGFPWAGA